MRPSQASSGSAPPQLACLREDLQHVQVSIGVELVPHIVGGDGHRDARLEGS